MNNFELLNTLQLIAQTGTITLLFITVISTNKAMNIVNKMLETKGEVEKEDIVLPSYNSFILANKNSILTLGILLGTASILLEFIK